MAWQPAHYSSVSFASIVFFMIFFSSSLLLPQEKYLTAWQTLGADQHHLTVAQGTASHGTPSNPQTGLAPEIILAPGGRRITRHNDRGT
jgi:hypothetical protein